MEDYECIKSVSALEDKEKEIREKDDLLNKAVGRIENTYLSLIHISEPTRRLRGSRMPSSA